MPFTKMLRTVSLGLLYLCGGLILVGFVAWLHYWIDGSLNPDKVKPLEDWSLTLGITSLSIQIASSIEALLFSIGTRFGWLGYKRGRTTVGLFGIITLFYTLFKLWLGITSPGMEFLSFFIFFSIELIILLPLGITWFLLHYSCRSNFR